MRCKNGSFWFLFCRGGTNRVFGKPCFCPLPKRGRFDENSENDEFALYPLKTRVSLLKPPKTTKMTKITQEKAWFGKSRVCTSLILVPGRTVPTVRVSGGSVPGPSCHYNITIVGLLWERVGLLQDRKIQRQCCNPQYTAKMHQKYSKKRILVIFGVFLPYFAGGGIFRGQLFPKDGFLNHLLAKSP